MIAPPGHRDNGDNYSIVDGVYAGPSVYKGNLDLGSEESQVRHLGNLKRVKGHLILEYTQVRDLGKLERVKGGLFLDPDQIRDLGNLRYVGGDIFLENSQITSLGKLKYVGGKIYTGNSLSREKYKLAELKDLLSRFSCMDLSELPLHIDHECLLIRNLVKHRLEAGQ